MLKPEKWEGFAQLLFHAFLSESTFKDEERMGALRMAILHDKIQRQFRRMFCFPDFVMKEEFQIIYYAVVKYVDDEKLDGFNNTLKSKIPQQKRSFFRILDKYVDLEKMKEQPVLRRDIWIYNYLQYDHQNRKSKLLKQYKNEVIDVIESWAGESKKGIV